MAINYPKILLRTFKKRFQIPNIIEKKKKIKIPNHQLLRIFVSLIHPRIFKINIR